MGPVLQLIPLVVALIVIGLAGELAWHYLRWRRLHRGIDIPMTPLSPRRYWGFRAKGVGAAIGLGLYAAAIAFGFADSTLSGYISFGVGVAALIVLLTAIYVWRARAISRSWWRRAEVENDPARNRKR